MKRSTPLLISGILGSVYALLLLSLFGSLLQIGGLFQFLSSLVNANNEAEAVVAVGGFVGGTIAIGLMLPQVILVLLAVTFTWIGWGTHGRWWALTAGILYCLAAFTTWVTILFVAAPLVLSFVAFATMKQQNPTTW